MGNPEIDYKISTYPSKYYGYWKTTGKINLYISSIWKGVEEDYPDLEPDDQIDKFMNELSNITLIETICLYRSRNKVKLKNKCKPHCKVARVANYLVSPDDWSGIKAFYKKVDKEDKENDTN
jgi:hypothetical protein